VVERMGGFPGFSSGGAVYRFSRRIGRGGMGEIFLGLQEAIGGLERLVVVKRIASELGDGERFTRLLLEEARIAASLHHPNVVQMLDIGRDASGAFVVMEYLSGETLVYITRTLRGRGERVSPAFACRIAADVAAGLHCAHTATDAAGNPQPIVHRDVTPSNLILCFNGAVKIVDFGVARASRVDRACSGGPKGKMSYLAPEQLLGLPVDGRTDVFQLGICLHELLTGQRLFRGEDDRQRAAAVMERPIPPPSEIVPELPAALDTVVLSALERDPDRRPATADEFRRALEGFLAESGMVGPHDLGAWMKAAFAQRLSARTQFERRCVAEMRGERAGSEPGSTPVSLGDDSGTLRFEYEPLSRGSDSVGRGAEASVRAAPGPRLPLPLVALALGVVAVLLAAGSAVAWNLDRLADRPTRAAEAPEVAAPRRARPAPAPASPPASRSFEVAIAATPRHATIEIDGYEVGRGSYRVSLPMDGARHILTVRADGFETARLDFSDEAPPVRIDLERRAAADEPRARSAKRPARRSGAGRRSRARTDNPDPWAGERRRSR
jgi:eukaryotic-like serine/threonine-protein kinase